MNADGTGATRLTNNVGIVDMNPAWSPDGTRIAFESDRDATPADPQNFEIYTMNPDGAAVTSLTNSPASDGSPAWSADGTKIAFSSTRDDPHGDIYSMSANGANVTRLTTNGSGDPGVLSSDETPSWSPDGSKLAFASIRDGTQSEIFTMTASGASQINRTGNPASDIDPDWQVGSATGDRPPSCSGIVATPSTLLPADDTMRLVAISGATDPDGDIVDLAITGVTQDEPLTGKGDHTSPDASLIPEPTQLLLRAERRQSGDGRVYRVVIAGSDGKGGTCTATVKVAVPRKGSAVDSAPPSYSSFGP